MYKRNACSPSKLPVIGLWYCSDRENGHISQIKQVEYQLVKRNQWYSDRGNGKNFGSSSLLQGLEIAGHPLTLMVNVSKFRCRNTACQRKVFSAPLSPLASSHARNTRKVEERIRSISLKTTSRIAGNLLHEQNIVCSQSSCLRRANVRILVADSIGLQSPSQSVQWSVITSANVECKGNTAVLRKDGKSFSLKIVSPVYASFTTRAAKRGTEAEKPIEGYTILSASVSGDPVQVIKVLLSGE